MIHNRIDVDSHTVSLFSERVYRAKAQRIFFLGDQLQNVPSVEEVLKEITEALNKLINL
jgi:hypothetical protein